MHYKNTYAHYMIKCNIYYIKIYQIQHKTYTKLHKYLLCSIHHESIKKETICFNSTRNCLYNSQTIICQPQRIISEATVIKENIYCSFFHFTALSKSLKVSPVIKIVLIDKLSLRNKAGKTKTTITIPVRDKIHAHTCNVFFKK